MEKPLSHGLSSNAKLQVVDVPDDTSDDPRSGKKLFAYHKQEAVHNCTALVLYFRHNSPI